MTKTTRKAIPTEIRLRLFASSAGHCQRPECLDSLYPEELNGFKHIAEMAHVLPHGKLGPRSTEAAEEYEADSFENLILLCPTCHTIIDKNPDAYPRQILLEWKEMHLANLATHQGIKLYGSRSKARAAVIQKLDENKAIWKKFAPIDGTEFEFDPESDKAAIWDQRVKGVILPNHYTIKSIIQANYELLEDNEREIFSDYQEHVRGLTNRHICGIGGAIRFPQGMKDIFK